MLSVEPGAVTLGWKDNAPAEAASIVQRCTGAECDGFQNHVGLPGEGHTSAKDDNALVVGKTYRYRVYMVVPTPTGPQGTGVSNVVSAVAK